jgi:hypothetical protein
MCDRVPAGPAGGLERLGVVERGRSRHAEIRACSDTSFGAGRGAFRVGWLVGAARVELGRKHQACRNSMANLVLTKMGV